MIQIIYLTYCLKTISQIRRKDFFELWETEQFKYLRIILLIFSISHIILVSYIIKYNNDPCDLIFQFFFLNKKRYQIQVVTLTLVL